jgi:orotate phosphoribosyltransferase
MLSGSGICRVVLIDDVITAGTAVRTTMNLLETTGTLDADSPQITPVAVFVILDREELSNKEANLSAALVCLLTTTFHLAKLTHSVCYCLGVAK